MNWIELLSLTKQQHKTPLSIASLRWPPTPFILQVSNVVRMLARNQRLFPGLGLRGRLEMELQPARRLSRRLIWMYNIPRSEA